MFDLEISFDRQSNAAHGPETPPPTSTALAFTCEACGHENPSRYQYCVQCGLRADSTLAHGAHAQIESRTRASIAAEGGMSQAIESVASSTADIVWDSLGQDDVTAVFDATEAGWPSASVDETVHDAAPSSVSSAANDAPTRVGDTELAPEPEAALLLQLAAESYPGQGAPVAVHLIVRDGFVDVGCDCAGPWADDAYLDGWHVRLLSAPGGVQVLDEGSRGGVWIRLDRGRWLLDGDRFRIGAQLLRFAAADRGRVQLVVDDEPVGPAVRVDEKLVLGREAADATFPHDPYVSAQHCRLVAVHDGVWLEDLSSSNGTWVRVRSGESIPFGSVIAMGASVYRIESGEP
jgi:hypothetical protein